MTNDAIHVIKKSNDVFVLPDNSIAYSMKRASSEYKKIKAVTYTASDLILLLLFSQDKPIRSKTILFKEMFIFEKEIFCNENTENCKFIPYYYGPYSFYMANKLDTLIQFGIISMTKKHGVAEFKLTDHGKKMITSKYNQLPTPIKEEMKNLRKGLDQHGVKHILKAVYNRPEYQKYIIKSRIAYKYKLITWGKIK